MISVRARNLKRYKDIAVLLAKYGRSDLAKALDSELRETGAPRTQGDDKETARQLAEDIKKMGPTYVKLGQILSTQSEILPAAYTEAFDDLQDNVDPFPYEDVVKTIEEDLHVKINKAFKTFDREPLAAASLSQVHRAVLHNGRQVAVKVQRPGVRQIIADDLQVLEDVAGLLSGYSQEYDWKMYVAELRHTTFRELDFHAEAVNLETLAENLKQFESIIVPRPVHDYTSARVLTMDCVQGRKITTIAPLRLIEINKDYLAGQFFRAYLQQILVDGFVHVDPHPGNIFLCDNEHLALFDVGMVEHLPPVFREQLLHLLMALSDGCGEDVADVIVKMCAAPADFEHTMFRDEIGVLVAEYHQVALNEVSVGHVFVKIMTVAAKSQLQLPGVFRSLGKALLKIDRTGRFLAPNFKPGPAIQSYLSGLVRQQFLQQMSPMQLLRKLMETGGLIQRLPGKLSDLLDMLTRNEIRIGVNAFNEVIIVEGLLKMANRIAMGLILAAMIVGAAVLIRVDTAFKLFGYPGLAILLFLGAAAGGGMLIVSILRSDFRGDHKE